MEKETKTGLPEESLNKGGKLQEDQDLNRYLLFTLGGEIYGTPLMAVREVCEFQRVKPIPHTVNSFLGVINIRGEIVGVVDLRVRLNYPPKESKIIAMMVFSTEEGALGAVADTLEGVAKINTQDIDPKPRIDSRVPTKYILGVGKHKNNLVTLIDLREVLEREEVVSLRLREKSLAA
jgi:purine-binding chemotaxis protein CheW